MPAPAYFRTLLALLALSTVACNGTMGSRHSKLPRTTSANLESPRAAAAPTIDDMRTREADPRTPLNDFRIRAANGVIDLHVKASAAPTMKHKKTAEGGAYSIVNFQIGGDTEATCHANAGPLDLAHWVEAVLTEVPTTLTEPPTIAVEVVEGHPILLVHTEGIAIVGGVKKRHIAKFAAMHLDRGSVACVHDGVGYEQTFRDLARHIAAKSKTPDATAPVFRQISVERDGDRVLGFEELRAYRGGENGGGENGAGKAGESRQMTLSSAVLSRDDGWTTSDAAWVGIVDAKGVVSERSMRRVGKRTAHDMSLLRKAPGLFTYEGSVNGDAKKGSFRARGPLVTRLSRAPAITAFLRDGKRKEVAFFHFDEKEPTAALREVFTREGGGQVAMQDAGKSYHCVLDSDGLCTKVWHDGSTWSVQRVYSAGNP
jgi:hypothetical protein